MKDLPIKLRNLGEFPEIREPEETGLTFAENASLKASYYSSQTGIYALADDSGLEVDALDGAPGVLSARYGGKDADDFQRNQKLLEEIKHIPYSERKSCFVCSMAIADFDKIITIQNGICSGTIAFTPAGENGFGYDPIFIPDEFENTFAQLDITIKQQISHRAQAIRKIIAFLRDFIAV